MPWNVAVVALMNAEQPQQMGRDLARRRASFPLPVEGVEVVGLTQHGPLANVERLC